MKKFWFLPILVLGCAQNLMDEIKIMGQPSQSIPVKMRALSDGRVAILFRDYSTYKYEVKLAHPRTGESKTLTLGNPEAPVLALRVGKGDTIFILTLEKGHIKLHEFTPNGIPSGKYVLKDAELPVDFLVTSSGKKGERIMTLNAAGALVSIFDRTGKLLAGAGPSTGPEGPYMKGHLALVQSSRMLLVVPNFIKSACANCPKDDIEGSIRVYQWIGEMTVMPDSFPLIKQIDVEPLFPDADVIQVYAARGCGDRAYVFATFSKAVDPQIPKFITGYALVKIDPSTGASEIAMTMNYEELYQGEDGRYYDEQGNYKPSITAADISRDGKKLFLAYADGHVEVCEIAD